MRLTIAAVGKMRGGPEAALTSDYLSRAADLGRNLGFAQFDVVEVEAPRTLAAPARKAREGEMLLKSAGEGIGGAAVIALDERGDNLSSEKFAAMLARRRDDGERRAVFLIGGADGHHETVNKRADFSLSFGAATWPHMLVRVMLAEQLYRAMTILSGHPYHRS